MSVCFIRRNGEIGLCLRENQICRGCLSEGMHNRFIDDIIKSMPQCGQIWFRERKNSKEEMSDLPERCNHEFDHLRLAASKIENGYAVAYFECTRCGKKLRIISDYFFWSNDIFLNWGIS